MHRLILGITHNVGVHYPQYFRVLPTTCLYGMGYLENFTYTLSTNTCIYLQHQIIGLSELKAHIKSDLPFTSKSFDNSGRQKNAGESEYLGVVTNLSKMFWLSAQIDSNVFGGSQPTV